MCLVINIIPDTGVPVPCRASVNCAGGPGDDLGMMTPRDCCVVNPQGLAYVPREGACIACVGEF